MPRFHELSACEVVDKVSRQEITAEEYAANLLGRIRMLDQKLHAYVTIIEETAIEKARQIDQKARKGEKLGRLAGSAIAVKDNISTKNVRTTCSSRMLEQFMPPYNATVVEKLETEDAVILGKTNMDEFAMGTTTESSYFGATRNPWNTAKVPGGSSGGSATAVAADESATALGSDTGGSIRCPASFCSTVGLKPTYGLVSRYGLIAYANSLEQIGPLAKNVQDCALLLSVLGGHDPRDSTSADLPAKDYVTLLRDGVKGFRIGLPAEFFGEGVEESVKKHVWAAIHRLEDLGATYEEFSVPSIDFALATYYVIAMSEASSNLARYDGLRYGYRVTNDDADWPTIYARDRRIGFGDEVRRRIILGTYALSAGYYEQYYLKALKVRTILRKDFEGAFKKFDLLIGPTMPMLPFNIGEKIEDPLTLYACDILTVPANLIGCPALSIPCGFSNNLPVGLQLIGKPFCEDAILQAAYTFEQNTDFHKRRPNLS